ncbi:hypothetical protein PG985_006514 [Apiospora marii]|uniref:Uncharacterized protein n=1 Tax=Apiospora marii TaxID=335849 RepID=A0ABR1S7U8_9PEZI
MSPSKKNDSEPTPVKIEAPQPQFRVLPETNNAMTTTLSELPGYKIVRTIGAVYGYSYTGSSGPFPRDSTVFKKTSEERTNKERGNQMYSCNNDALARITVETQARGGNAVIRLRHNVFCHGPYEKVFFTGTAAVVEKL